MESRILLYLLLEKFARENYDTFEICLISREFQLAYFQYVFDSKFTKPKMNLVLDILMSICSKFHAYDLSRTWTIVVYWIHLFFLPSLFFLFSLMTVSFSVNFFVWLDTLSWLFYYFRHFFFGKKKCLFSWINFHQVSALNCSDQYNNFL